jgi:hypothetical protein
MSVRTGPYQPPGNTWPGIFILGDEAMFKAAWFRKLAEEMEGPEWGKAMLQQWAQLLDSCQK